VGSMKFDNFSMLWRKKCSMCHRVFSFCKPEFFSEYFGPRSRHPDGLKEVCRECDRSRNRKIRASYGPGVIDKIQRRKSPEKYRAREILRDAVRKKQVVKPDKCQDCKAKVRLEGHHSDYSKPLKVLWLCRTCHVAIHKNVLRGE